MREGTPWVQMNKLLLFDPDSITETRFSVGRHVATPDGRVVYPERDELILLRYRHLGWQYLIARHAELRAGLKRGDLDLGYGHKYLWSHAKNRSDWEQVRRDAVMVKRGYPWLSPGCLKAFIFGAVLLGGGIGSIFGDAIGMQLPYRLAPPERVRLGPGGKVTSCIAIVSGAVLVGGALICHFRT